MNLTSTVSAFLFIMLWSGYLSGQSPPENDSQNNSLPAQNYLQTASEHYNNFKNGPAFDALHQYALESDKHFAESLNQKIQDTIAYFDNKLKSSGSELKEINSSINKLQQQNDSVESEKNSLLRNTIIFFLLLLTAASLTLSIWNKKVNTEIKEKNDAGIRLKSTEMFASVSEKSGKLINDSLFSFHSIEELTPKILAQTGKIRAMNSSANLESDKVEEAEADILRLNEFAANGTVTISNFKEYFRPDEERKLSNLNQIIDDTMYLSYLWIKSRYREFECAMSQDLEKILPELVIQPSEIRKALFLFFNNAFHAVQRKSLASGNDYKGKVAVISRKLPRFIQVRIRDNGIGLTPEVSRKMFDPFFSTLPPAEGSGLGLNMAADIIKQKHQGEVNTETESGTRTDVVIRFPIKI